jgi:hypothetical protein
MRHQMPDGGMDRTVAVVDFGASSTTFSVLRDMKVIYTRDFAFGGQQLTEEIMRTYGLSMEEAGRAKKEGGLPSNYQPEVLDPFIDDMTQQVSRSLQFYLASGSGRSQPDQILICGGCANIPGVAEVISSRVGVPGGQGRSARQHEGVIEGQGASRRPRRHRVTDSLRPRAAKLRLKEQPCRVSIYFPGANKNAKSDVANSWIAAGGAVFAAIIFAGGGKLAVLELDRRAEREEQSAEEGDRQARRTDRRHPGSREPQAAPGRAHGNHREAAAQAARDRASVRRPREDGARGRLSHAIKQTGNKLEIHGVAQSSTRVSTFMRNIDASVWMDNPVLQVVESAKDSPTGGSNFTLTAMWSAWTLENGGETTVKKVAAK